MALYKYHALFNKYRKKTEKSTAIVPKFIPHLTKTALSMAEKLPHLPTLTKKELKNLYNISGNTLRKWIKSIQHLLTMKSVDKTIPPHDLQIIIDNYGIPEKLEIG